MLCFDLNWLIFIFSVNLKINHSVKSQFLSNKMQHGPVNGHNKCKRISYQCDTFPVKVFNFCSCSCFKISERKNKANINVTKCTYHSHISYINLTKFGHFCLNFWDKKLYHNLVIHNKEGSGVNFHMVYMVVDTTK